MGGVDLHALLIDEPSKFWKTHQKLFHVKDISDEFKELFTLMTLEDPEKRMTIEEIKRSIFF